jgi:CheY-like chemotaxis protein
VEEALPAIVAIDDDPITRQLFDRSLSAMGFICHTARTGTEGLALIGKEHPDLVLLDLILEGDDGFRICKEIRQTWTTNREFKGFILFFAEIGFARKRCSVRLHAMGASGADSGHWEGPGCRGRASVWLS